MDFAAKQLEKYGWKQGQGLGKKKSGISSAIKVALKRDTAGVGYDASSEFTCQWWSAAFDKAISGVTVQDTEDGVVVESKDTQTAPSTVKQRQCGQDRSALLYGRFRKPAENLEVGKEMALQDSSRTVDIDGNDEVLRRRGSFSSTHRAVQAMSDEQLLKACGGRTAHKAARHGLKLSGKLRRIAKQDRALAETVHRGKGEGTQEKGEVPSSPRKRAHRNRQVEVAVPAQHKPKRSKRD